ncbi:YbaK/EbsC family protein [Paenibacillus rhizoplanae]
MESLHNEGSRRVQAALTEGGYPNKVVKLSDNAHTAQAAADSLGCDVAQIAKSIVFRLKEIDSPLLVIASGINRVNEKENRGRPGPARW